MFIKKFILLLVSIIIFFQYKITFFYKDFNSFINYKPKIISRIKFNTSLKTDEIYYYYSKLLYLLRNNSCIVKAVSFKQISDIYGKNADIKFGFRKNNNNLFGHAWNEANGKRLISKFDDNSEYIKHI